ncbi:hypothetical protein OAI73_01705 [Gammaproteobacteria bacterium]|nr:hypothetical protein [Gammaproteobacteria bacterium]
MNKFNELLTNHISRWNMVWFGLIFWGSIFNALALNFGFDKNPLFFYIIGFLFGLLAKLRGTWLWKT